MKHGFYVLPKLHNPLNASLIIGLFIILCGYIIETVGRVSIITGSGSVLSAQEILFDFQRQNTDVLSIASASLQLFAGFVVGRRMKQKGWLYGGILGIIWVFLISLVTYLYLLDGINLASQTGSPEFIQTLFTQNNLNIFLSTIPLTLLRVVFITTLGGEIAELTRPKEKKKEV